MKYFISIFIFICITVVCILGFRGSKSTKPPIYIFPDMDFQQKYQPQGKNDFFADCRDDRPVVAGTVMRGYGSQNKEVFAKDFVYGPSINPGLYSGKDSQGSFLQNFPIEITNALMAEGQSKYNTYCIVCHGASGDGNGITKQYGMVATASYHNNRLREMPVGEFFDTVTHGKKTMLGYADKLKPEQRWAVIAYVRALQRSQHASIEDVPEEYKAELGL